MGEALKLKVWEALAATGCTPTRAVMLMESQNVIVTVAEAEEHLAEARRRNTLRLVKAGELPERNPVAHRLRSNWLRPGDRKLPPRRDMVGDDF